MAVTVQKGQPLPRVRGEAQGNRTVDVNELAREKNVVLYFYPRDNTPGCTREAHAFQENLEAFRAAGTEVVGVSVQSVASHEEFAEQCGLEFPLIADTSKEIASTLGVLNEKGSSALRTTFVIAKGGTVAEIFEDVKVDGHVDEVLEAVRGLG